MTVNLKVGITGHTKGIGKVIYDSLIKDGYVVAGFSRSNGYNIKYKEDRDKINLAVKDFDVFINNAYNYDEFDDSQLEMLKVIFASWSNDKQKCILNMSSGAADLFDTALPLPDNMKKYIESKNKQDKFLLSVRNYLNTREQVRLINIKPGRVLTEKTLEQWKDHIVLEPNQVYNIIKSAIEEKNVEFTSVTFKAFEG